ncbi:hypothetical protein [Pontimicrobium sp. IMCC45349]|uniref:hypothetical protein n=1 Tax=Pontimicrobium sp. IMCC45349 TaxID=3391574 RepID=UPI0039A22A42
MKKFLIKSSLFLFLSLGTILLVFFQADGFTDPMYVRFTTPKQNSLILGTSKAAQGLRPSILNKALGRNDIYNYAFTLRLSPYGPTYLESIKRKLQENSKDGVFILTVGPWSIFSDAKQPNNPEYFDEANRYLGLIKSVDAKPNVSYLVHAFEDLNIKMIYNNSPLYLHENGWLEVLINVGNQKFEEEFPERVIHFDSIKHKRNIKASLKRYNKKMETFKYSETRLEYLVKTIDYLKTKGEVYLVRLPVSKEMQKLDSVLMPNFNAKISRIATNENVPYIDLMNLSDKCLFNDATHLNRESSNFVSFELAKKIKDLDNVIK